MKRNEVIIFSRLVFFIWMLPIAAQQIGVDLCACQPSVYSIQLQFNLTCADATVTQGLPGIVDVTCLVDKTTDENVTDFQPSTVNEIQILEIDQDGNIARQILFADGYADGDIIQYSSTVLMNSSEITTTSVPSALSVFLTATNAAGQQILNTWAVEFNNDCSVYPVLTVGQRIGWTVFNDLEAPPVVPVLCPLVSSMPSEMPSTAPNLERTSVPVLPTLAPVNSTVSPNQAITSAPVVMSAPTSAPIDQTLGPNQERTLAPVIASIPSSIPISVPSKVPIDPTMGPNEERTMAPVIASVPTSIPVIPTLSPILDRTSAPVRVPVPTRAPVDSTKSPHTDRTSAPSCEFSGKRNPRSPTPKIPVSQAVGERKSKDPVLSAFRSPVMRRRRRKRTSKPAEETKSSDAYRKNRSGTGKNQREKKSANSVERRLGVGPHAPYAYPSRCPEPRL